MWVTMWAGCQVLTQLENSSRSTVCLYFYLFFYTLFYRLQFSEIHIEQNIILNDNTSYSVL